MLTSRLTEIKNDLRSKSPRTSNEIKLLELIEKVDFTEQRIVSAFNSSDSQRLLEMIVKPGGDECPVCGRTLHK